MAFFLAFVLVTRKGKSDADVVLVIWLVVIGFHLCGFYLFYTAQDDKYPSVIAAGFPLPLVHGPLLYLYTRLETSGERFTKRQLLHLIPVALSYLLFVRFFFLPFEQKVTIFKHKGQGFEIPVMINLLGIYVSGIIYTGLSLVTLLRYKRNLVNNFSNTDKISFNWLLYLIVWMVVIWMIVLFIGEDQLIFGAAALFVLWLGYFGIRQVKIFQQPVKPVEVERLVPHHTTTETIVSTLENEKQNDQPIQEDATNLKYQKSTLTEEDAAQIHARLKVLMAEKKPFTNPDLTLNDLAKSLIVHPNHLSQVINSRENKSFYDLINERRIEEFTRLVALPSHRQFTLVSIAYECGFNSKASFNRNFKKYTGLTPTEYVKGLKSQVA